MSYKWKEEVQKNTQLSFWWKAKSSSYSRSSRKRPPGEFRKLVATRAGRLQEWALVSYHMMKKQRAVAYKRFYRKAWPM